MNDQRIKTAGQHSLKALTWLRDHHLPAEPVYYAIAFEAQFEENAELKQRLAQLTQSPSQIEAELTLLFEDLVSKKYSNRSKDFNINVRKVLDDTRTNLGSSNQELIEYAQSLTRAQQQLSDPSLEAPINIISLMLKETAEVNERSLLLERQLEDAANQIESLQNEYLEVRERSLKDPLTQLLNRNGVEDAIEHLELQNPEIITSVIMVDIDLFKLFNDNHGHLLGDRVLQLVAETLSHHLKRSDIIGRFGGEEFVIVLPATSLDKAKIVAENLRSKVEHLTIKRKADHKPLEQITISLGATQRMASEAFTDALDRADQALYLAKQNGRNCVVCK